MKKNIIKILLLGMMIVCVGCTNSNNNGEDNTINVQENINAESRVDNEKMYKIHEELLPKVKQLYIDKGFTVYENNFETGDYKGITSLDGDSDNAGNEYTRVLYAMSFNEERNVKDIGGTIYMNINEDSYIDNKFNLEDTMFYELSKIISKEDIDYTEINEQINEAILNKDYKNINNMYGNVEVDILITPDEIKYSISILPE